MSGTAALPSEITGRVGTVKPVRKNSGPAVRRGAARQEEAAGGRADLEVEADFAAAALIAREAGACVGHLGEVPAGQLPELWGRESIVAAPGIYAALCDLLRD